MAKIFVKRPVTTFMVILIVIAFGVLSIKEIKLEMFPNMNVPIAIVRTTYDGVGPEEMENLITVPLEGVLGTVPGVKNITSNSSNGTSIVIIEYEQGTNIDNAALDMREKVDLIKGMLPDDASEPMVLKINMNDIRSLEIGVSSQKLDLVTLNKTVKDKVMNRLERQDGVASVSISGGKQQEISVTLHEDKLRGYGISEAQVSQLLMAENRNAPAGSIKEGDKTLTIRITGEFESLEEIEDLPITSPKGTVVYLRDIADVDFTYKDNTSISYINGVPSVALTIQKQSVANSVELSDKVNAELDRLKVDFPDLEFKVLSDPADFIKMSISSVIGSAIQGGILAIIILFLFLRNVRTTLIVAASMPISIIATFTLMYYGKITLNMMSLGGLTLGIGMLVDNSIVVLESIFRKLEEGESAFAAAIDGAKEVSASVTASTLTTVVVFLPITFAGGFTAEIFNQLSLTIAFSLFSSLFVSLTFVPMCCSILFRNGYTRAKKSKLDFVGNAIERIEVVYKRVLEFCLRRRKLTIVIVAGFVALTLASLTVVGFELMPVTDEGSVSVSISMPRGTILSETEKTAFEAIGVLEGVPEIKEVYVNIGGGGTMSMLSGTNTDRAQLTVLLADKKDRNRTTVEVATDIEKRLKKVPGAKFTADAASSMGMMMSSGGVDLNIMGADMEMLQNISEDMLDIFERVPGTRQVKTSIDETTPQASIKVNRAKATSLGIAPSGIAGIVNTAVSGNVVTTYKLSGDEFDIRVRQNKAAHDYLSDIENLLIPTPSGVNVPLYELAEISVRNLPSTITRENSERYITVSAVLDGRDTKSVMNDIQALLDQYSMPPGYTAEFSGSVQQMNETFGDLGFALVLALLLVYMIMAAEFESLLFPLIVMFSIPIALTGGLSGLFVTGQSLSITGFLGLIMLAGVVINNAIVLIDYTNLQRKERGKTMHEALTIAGPVRLRPILMSTLTTVLALIPMLFSSNQGAELMRGLATVVVFGLSLSTLVTLLFIPVVYTIAVNTTDKAKRFIANKFSGGKAV